MEQGMSMNSSVHMTLRVRGSCSWGFVQSLTILPQKHITVNDLHLLWNTLVLEYSQCISSPHLSGRHFIYIDVVETVFFWFFFSPNRRPSAIVPFLFYCSSRSKRCSASIVCLRVRCIIAEVWIINWSVEYISLNDSIVCALSLQAGCGVKCEYFFFKFFLFQSSAAHVMFSLKLKPDPLLN